MKRTSLVLPVNLHQRLLQASQRENQSISRLIAKLVDQGLAASEADYLDTIYFAWDMMKGVIRNGNADVASTIDETLYGEQGSWKGTLPPEAP